MARKDLLFLIFGPFAAGILLIGLMSNEVDQAIAITSAITLWTGIWWVTEPIPIPVASMLPLALFPTFSILTPAQVERPTGAAHSFANGGVYSFSSYGEQRRPSSCRTQHGEFFRWSEQPKDRVWVHGGGLHPVNVDFKYRNHVDVVAVALAVIERSPIKTQYSLVTRHRLRLQWRDWDTDWHTAEPRVPRGLRDPSGG